MEKLSDSTNEALEYLKSEGSKAQNLIAGQAELARLAHRTLRRKGAYILGIAGSYGGQDGIIGSSNRGIFIVQGTEPVLVGTTYVALKDTQQDRARSVELVSSDLPGPTYIAELSNGATLAKIGQTGLQIPGVAAVQERHVAATKTLVEMIASELADVLPLHHRDYNLPRVLDTYIAPFPAGEVFNVRTGHIESSVLYT